MTYDEASGFWIDGGCRYIKNEFDPGKPVYIEILRNRWTGIWNHQSYFLYWPSEIDQSLREVISGFWKCELRYHAISILPKYGSVLRSICEVGGRSTKIEDLLDSERLKPIWDGTKEHNRSFLRVLVKELHQRHAQPEIRPIELIIDGWKARKPQPLLSSILEWSPNTGSMSSSELETLRKLLEVAEAEEDLCDHFARLMVRIALATLRRTFQITGIPAGGLHRISSTVGEEAMLQIPYAKAQTGRKAKLEPIPINLADDIEAYRARDTMKNSKAGAEFLLPLLHDFKMVPASASHTKMLINRWLRKIGIKSPRTGKLMHVTIRRLRHTGATHMAMQGYSAELIQDILQHDGPQSARAYIDAVGAEFLPIFEKADHRLGGKFSAMRDAWFKGQIVKRPIEVTKPIIVPDATAPAIVGSCASKEKCPLHPLFSCYSCQEFLAFRDADHERVLDFVEEEYKRWHESERSNSRSKAMKDFDRIAVGVRSVIDKIHGETSDDKC